MLQAQHARKAPRAAVRRVGWRTAEGQRPTREHEDAWRRGVAHKLLGEGEGEVHAVQHGGSHSVCLEQQRCSPARQGRMHAPHVCDDARV